MKDLNQLSVFKKLKYIEFYFPMDISQIQAIGRANLWGDLLDDLLSWKRLYLKRRGLKNLFLDLANPIPASYCVSKAVVLFFQVP